MANVLDKSSLQYFHHHHHVPEGLGILACSLILKMKLVPPFTGLQIINSDSLDISSLCNGYL